MASTVKPYLFNKQTSFYFVTHRIICSEMFLCPCWRCSCGVPLPFFKHEGSRQDPYWVGLNLRLLLQRCVMLPLHFPAVLGLVSLLPLYCIYYWLISSTPTLSLIKGSRRGGVRHCNSLSGVQISLCAHGCRIFTDTKVQSLLLLFFPTLNWCVSGQHCVNRIVFMVPL